MLLLGSSPRRTCAMVQGCVGPISWEDAKTTAASARGCTSAPLCCALDVHVVGLTQPKHASIRGSSLNLLRGSDPPADQAAAKKQPTGTAKPKTTLVIGKSTWEGEPPHEGLRESPGRISLVGGLAKIPDTSFHHRFLCRSCASWCTSRERYSWERCHRREKTPSRSLVAAATLTCPAFSNTIRWVNGSTTWSRHIGAYSGSASSDGVHRCCQIQCLLDALWWHPPMFAQAGPEQSSSPVSGADSDRRWQGSPVLAPTTLPSMLNQGFGRALHPVPKIRYRSGGEHMSPVLTPCPLCAELLDLLGMDPFQIQVVEREPLSP